MQQPLALLTNYCNYIFGTWNTVIKLSDNNVNFI
jgi:hypothetical protein